MQDEKASDDRRSLDFNGAGREKEGTERQEWQLLRRFPGGQSIVKYFQELKVRKIVQNQYLSDTYSSQALDEPRNAISGKDETN